MIKSDLLSTGQKGFPQFLVRKEQAGEWIFPFCHVAFKESPLEACKRFLDEVGECVNIYLISPYSHVAYRYLLLCFYF